MGIINFTTFIVTALLFIITPGIDTVFVLNKSINNGRKSGFQASIGVNTGVLVHTAIGALGISVLISKSVIALIALKYLGALYLVYLGVMSIKSKSKLITKIVEGEPIKVAKNDFWSGFITNTLNPKVALFILAFFPQFINPTQIENPIPFFILGLTFAIMGVFWYSGLTVFASFFSDKIKNNPNSGILLNRVSGIVFILMAILMAI
tara:strand:+ start:1311 stop:1931 length:621 start_codon:yes stop_codon:yes gene_type:complete